MWTELKIAIDLWREEGQAAIAEDNQELLHEIREYCREVMAPLDLWDNANDYPDDDLIRELYLRRT